MEQELVRKTLLEAAVIASYGVGRKGVFRQRDVRFFYDLFSNWIDPIPGSRRRVGVQNTQIARFVESLAKSGIAERETNASEGKKKYTLSFREMPKLLRQILERDYSDAPAVAFFVFLFCKFYFIPFIHERMRETHKRFHTALRRLLDIANPGLFIEAQLFYVDERLRGFDRVFAIQEEADELIEEQGFEGAADHWLDEVETEVSFFLHSEKPVKKLVRKGGTNRVEWEAKRGRHERLSLLWKSEVERLKIFREQLQQIR